MNKIEKHSKRNQRIVTIDTLMEYLSAKAEIAGVPLRAFLEVTTRCNFRCVHCYNSRSFDKKELTYTEICYVLDQLADMGTLFLDISGGEPLIRPDFCKIIEYARKKEFLVTLFSNGLFITPEVAKRLADLFIYKVAISIYGMNEESYKSVTGINGVFKRILNAVECLSGEGIATKLTMVLMRKNFLQLEAFDKLVKKIGIEHEVAWKLDPCYNRNIAPIGQQLSLLQFGEFFSRYPKYCMPTRRFIPTPLSLLCDKGGFGRMSINSSGEAMPCLYLSSVCKHGNIRNKPLIKILKNDSLFKRLRNIRLRDIPKCMRCKVFMYCPLCPADFAMYTGRLISSPIKKLCKIAWIRKKIYERLEHGNSSLKISH